MDELRPKRYSKIWKYFTRKGTNKDIATCKICNQDYCYKTINNLTSHLKKQHSNYYNKDTSDVDSNHSEEDSKISLVNNETASHSTWQYFDIPDDSIFEAKCKICEQDISYDNVSDLTKHIREHDVMVSDDDDFEMDTEKLKIQSSSISRKRSPVWKYMEVINDKYAICMLCRKKLSYFSTISNLKKHLTSSHPHINFSEGEHKVLTSANGKVYEVQALRVENDPIEVNEYYIESDFDIEDNENKRATTPVRKILKKHREIKRNENVQEEINESRSRRTSSDSDILTKRKSSQDSKKDTIDFFGSYVMSMLRELPKQVSDRLQSEIVNQIITAKIALDTQNNRLHKPTMSNGKDDTASEEKRNDIWNYFEEENKKARCVECHDIISDISYDSLKAHLFAQHPKLLLDLVQEQDALEDSHLVLKSATDDEDDSNTFTEVVYLEQDLAEDTLQKKSKNINVFNPKRATKRNRNNSSSDHPIIKQIKDEEIPKADADTELDTFLKYIRCLLKKLSPDGFSKVQIDILKTIMDAVTADKITVTNNSSVPNIHIPHSSMGNIIKIGELGSQNLNNFTLKLIETVPSVTVSDDVKQN